MDFSLREWLIVVGVIVIVGVLIDGYRRVRSGSRGRIKMSIDKSQKYSNEDRMDYFSGELPNGGARVVNRSGDAETDSVSTPVEKPVSAFDVAHELRPDPLFADDYEPEISAPADDVSKGEIPPAVQEPTQPETVAETVIDESPVVEPAPQPEPQKAAFQEVEEVIVMNVFAKDDSGFNGSDLMRVILACGMRYGDMDIFHREEEGAGAAIQFSMANLVKPGTFNLDEMDNFSTPGVSFFLSLPGPKNSMKALDYMYETAQCVVKNLNGELKDEMHSAMTSQTIEHSRQKVRDFERRQLSLLR
jgi:cell division protein ZipA